MNPKFIWQRLPKYAKLIRFDRPIGTFLLMWPALWALWFASSGQPNWTTTLVFVMGVILMRSAGCAINDYADRNFDCKVTRTCHRPLAVGEIQPKEAIGVFLTLSLIAFALVLTQNLLTVLLSVIALLLTMIYPFMKRFIHLPQLILGAAFGWAVPMAFAATTGTVPNLAWWIFAATIIWALVYDTQYAMVDRADDLRIGIKSSAILFGSYDRLIIGILQILMITLLIIIGKLASLHSAYFTGIAMATGLAGYQQYLIWNREPSACFQAFLHNNYFGMTIFIGIVLDYIIMQ
ncbi:4-hydroxybenzoate polyprenyltransferase [Achromatium sp. WMS2]|nr:4-hydroxybenzoate polyprenyltransferase [Achromatium sp. WMS2]